MRLYLLQVRRNPAERDLVRGLHPLSSLRGQAMVLKAEEASISRPGSSMVQTTHLGRSISMFDLCEAGRANLASGDRIHF